MNFFRRTPSLEKPVVEIGPDKKIFITFPKNWDLEKISKFEKDFMFAISPGAHLPDYDKA